jgi:hypothetical protein
MTPREFCQEQLRMLGDEDLIPAAQRASLEILHTTIMRDLDADAFETRLRLLADVTGQANGAGRMAAQVARVLLAAWLEATGRDAPRGDEGSL